MMIKPDMPPIFTEPFEEEPSLYARTFDEDIRILKCSLVDIIGGKVDEWPPVAFDLFSATSGRVLTYLESCPASVEKTFAALLIVECATIISGYLKTQQAVLAMQSSRH